MSNINQIKKWDKKIEQQAARVAREQKLLQELHKKKKDAEATFYLIHVQMADVTPDQFIEIMGNIKERKGLRSTSAEESVIEVSSDVVSDADESADSSDETTGTTGVTIEKGAV